jgi:hypothetical protein
MGNEARVRKEISAAVGRLSIPDFNPQLVEKAAIDCVDIESAHSHAATNINQQVDQLLRQLGAQVVVNAPGLP